MTIFFREYKMFFLLLSSCLLCSIIMVIQSYIMYRDKIHKRLKNQFTRAKNLGTARQIFGTMPRLPVPRLPPGGRLTPSGRLPPGGSLGTRKILSTGATLHLGPIRLHVENWECRALKSSARCKKFGVPCRFF